ncbi:ABC transporter substrate-binding protein [Candidatus Binatia bacterium]|nr:ABC transporter substrate-binding protein [Candidatus Binatia bacterium]
MKSGLKRFLAILSLLVAEWAAAGSVPRVAIVKSSSVGPFDEAMKAIVAVLAGAAPQPEVLTFDLDGDPARGAPVFADVRRAAPQLVVTIGSLATAAALKEDVAAPLVFSMVLYPQQSGFLSVPGRRVTGASLDIPLDVQFAYLRRLFPNRLRVGVLYHPAETGAVVEEARGTAARHGFELVGRQVDDPTRALAELEKLMNEVDVLWSVADGHVFTSQNTSALILATMRRGKPLFGLSTAQVRAGALAALSSDYTDIGKQTGEVAVAVLRAGDAPVPTAVPRKVGLALNLRTAEHLGVNIPPDLQSEAREVIR